MSHSLLAPSSADRWLPCPASVQMCLSCSQTGGARADEGTVAHDVARQMVLGGSKGDLPGRLASKLMDTVIDGVTITKEITDGALLYAKHVIQIMQYSKIFGGKNMGIEQKIQIPSVHDACFGTPDFWLYDHHEKSVYIPDFKFGRRVVEPFANWQLLCYLRGVLDLIDGDVDRIFLTIVQPRAPHKEGPIRTWTINKSDMPTLNGFFIGLRESAQEAMGPSPHTCAGYHCRDCPAMLNCAANQKAAAAVVELTGDMGQSVTDVDSLWFELYILKQAKKLAESRHDVVEAEIISRMENGEKVNNCELNTKPGNLKWEIPYSDVVELGKTCGVDLNNQQTRTPKQAMDAGVPKEIIEQFAKRKTGKNKLVLTDTRRVEFMFGKKE